MTEKKLTQVVTGVVRFSYVHLMEPYAQVGSGQEPKYQTAILIPKSDTKTLEKIKKAQRAAYEEGKGEKLKGLRFEKVKTTLRDGDEESDEHPEYAGNMFMNVSSKSKPTILGTQRDADGSLKEITDGEEIYSGMYGRASLNFFAYNSQGNKGISAGLNNVQKTKDGEVLGGTRTDAQDDFDDWEDDTDDDDFLN
ncbi:MAG: DUF2815 family protein [Lactobacillus sp.]|jgi:hypothetical protein|nr:DUF2815 family protein [Lactobacillus sp.]